MTTPTRRGHASLKRLCRYLVGRPRLVHVFDFQEAPCIHVYTDTDLAGCTRTRKSTSGGFVTLWKHTIKTWSSTQSLTSLWSGEVEYHGLTKGVGQGLGYQGLMQDFGVVLHLDLHLRLGGSKGNRQETGIG